MTTSEHRSFLPEVGETDLLGLVFEDVMDPTHENRWKHFSESQKVLARELLKRAGIEAQGASPGTLSPLDHQKLILDTVTFAFSALEHAMRRTQTENGTNY